ncbi:ATP-binding cassette domain-containing protein [Butyrivibrio sp. MC2013]|uniref:ATP-binding cassette domain-containing protein n=1 Tax=Butyrivibrio sp. MC2013 TaxID=1280686 RepID=UPI0004030972|nr:ABC transporter ATP-binding protein [Butyrivibrio sp. MC2013]
MNNKEYKIFFLATLFLLLVSSVTALICPVLINHWINLGENVSVGKLTILLLILLASAVLQLTITYLRERYARQYNVNNFKKLLRKLFDTNYDYIQKNGMTNLIELIQEAVNNIYGFMTGSYIAIWGNALIVTVLLVIMACNSIPVAIMMAAVVPVNYLGYRFLNSELRKRSEILQRESAQGFQEIVSYVDSTDYVKQCGNHDIIIKQMQPSIDRMYKAMADINTFAQGMSQAIQSFNGIIQTAILCVVVINYLHTDSAIMQMILISIVFPTYFRSVNAIADANLSKQNYLVSSKFEMELDAAKEDTGTEKMDSVESVEVDIPILRIANRILSENINISIQPGDVIWIRGDSGKGKSTLVKDLVKFRVNDGIKINNIPISQYSNESLRQHISYLSQNIPIINGTLRDNIFLNHAYNAIREEKLLNSNILGPILSNKTMNTLIMDKGANLSGGEKQRIGAARLLIDNSDLLILDEITSNLDKRSGRQLLEQILSDNRGKMVVIISHDDLPREYANKVVEL